MIWLDLTSLVSSWCKSLTHQECLKLEIIKTSNQGIGLSLQGYQSILIKGGEVKTLLGRIL
jgi:hypothetical protein